LKKGTFLKKEYLNSQEREIYMARMKNDRKTPAFICTKIHLSAIWNVHGFY